MRRCGLVEQAFSEAQAGYGMLRGGEDRFSTLAEAFLILRLLDDTAADLNRPQAAHSEMSDALAFLDGMPDETAKQVPELNYWKKWLAQRLASRIGRIGQ